MDARPAKLESYRSPEVAESYDARWLGASGRRRQRRKARALGRALSGLQNMTQAPLRSVLDAPCGTARFTSLLEGRGLAYAGVDLALPMLRAARDKARGSRFVAADLMRLPFADGAFDAAVCIRFLHLVRDPQVRAGFLAELRRVTRAGVVLDYRHRHTVRVQSRLLRHRLGLRERPPGNPSRAEIRAEIGAAGWQRQIWIAVHRAPYLSDKLLVAAAP